MIGVGALADRLLARIVPKTSALALACDFEPCRYVTCSCDPNTHRWLAKLCCKTESGAHCCYACTNQGTC